MGLLIITNFRLSFVTFDDKDENTVRLKKIKILIKPHFRTIKINLNIYQVTIIHYLITEMCIISGELLLGQV